MNSFILITPKHPLRKPLASMPGTPVRNVNNPFEPIILKRVRPALVHHHDSMADSPPLSPLKVHSVSSLNTQLLAHGFAKRPLRLDNLTDAEQINVTSVIVELLGANVVSAGPHFLQTIGINCSSPNSPPSSPPSLCSCLLS